jgi:hypothetical protein
LIADIKTKIKETLSDKLVNIGNVAELKYSINKYVNEFRVGTFTHKYLIGNNNLHKYLITNRNLILFKRTQEICTRRKERQYRKRSKDNKKLSK